MVLTPLTHVTRFPVTLTNTAADRKGSSMNPLIKIFHATLAVVLLLCAPLTRGAMTVGAWNPIFKGVDSSVSENTPSASLPNQHVVYAVRVDLTDPDIHFRSTPRVPSNYQNNLREVI